MLKKKKNQFILVTYPDWVPRSSGFLRLPCLCTVPSPGKGTDKPYLLPRAINWLQLPSTQEESSQPFKQTEGLSWREMPSTWALWGPSHFCLSPHGDGGHFWAFGRWALLSRTDLRKVCLAIRGFCFVLWVGGGELVFCIVFCFVSVFSRTILNTPETIQQTHP